MKPFIQTGLYTEKSLEWKNVFIINKTFSLIPKHEPHVSYSGSPPGGVVVGILGTFAGFIFFN